VKRSLRQLLEELDMKPQFHVPLITYPDTSSLSLVQNAVDFARHQKADLTASIMQIGMPLAGQTSPWIDDIERLNSEAKRFSQDGYVALSEALYEYAREADIRALIQTFEVSEPLVPARFTEISRAYDLSIMEVSETTIPLVERLVFDSGRPLALFPANHVCNRIDTVAIAWDGSAPLSAALTGARLFLESASKIILIPIRRSTSQQRAECRGCRRSCEWRARGRRHPINRQSPSRRSAGRGCLWAFQNPGICAWRRHPIIAH